MINVVYNNYSTLAPSSGAYRGAYRWYKKFHNAGYDVRIRKLEENDLKVFSELEIDIRSQVNSHSLCWLIIYDDKQKRKYITNESREISFEDVGLFRTRQERRVEMQEILARLHATCSLASSK